MPKAALDRDAVDRLRSLEEQVRRLRIRKQATGAEIEFLELEPYLYGDGEWVSHGAMLMCQRWSDGSGLVWGEGLVESLGGNNLLAVDLPVLWRPREFTLNIVPEQTGAHADAVHDTPYMLEMPTWGDMSFRQNYPLGDFFEAFAFYGIEYSSFAGAEWTWPLEGRPPFGVAGSAGAPAALLNQSRGSTSEYGSLSAGNEVQASTFFAPHTYTALQGGHDNITVSFTVFMPASAPVGSYVGHFLRANDDAAYLCLFTRVATGVRREILKRLASGATTTLASTTQTFDFLTDFQAPAQVTSWVDSVNGGTQRVRFSRAGSFITGSRTVAQGWCEGSLHGFVAKGGCEILSVKLNRFNPQVPSFGFPPEGTVLSLAGVTYDAAAA